MTDEVVESDAKDHAECGGHDDRGSLIWLETEIVEWFWSQRRRKNLLPVSSVRDSRAMSWWDILRCLDELEVEEMSGLLQDSSVDSVCFYRF
jgi:hypothetical protein